MPGKVLLDTNIVIALFSGEKVISEHLAGTEVAIPSIVLGELYYGARKSGRSAANLTRIDHFAARSMSWVATRWPLSTTGESRID